MRSWTDRLVLGGLAILGGGLISLGAGKAIAQYTISGSPVLVATSGTDEAEFEVASSSDGLIQLVESESGQARGSTEQN